MRISSSMTAIVFLALLCSWRVPGAYGVEPVALPPQVPARTAAGATNITDVWLHSGGGRLYWNTLVTPGQIALEGARFADPAAVPELAVTPKPARKAPTHHSSRRVKVSKAGAHAATSPAPKGVGKTALRPPSAKSDAIPPLTGAAPQPNSGGEPAQVGQSGQAGLIGPGGMALYKTYGVNPASGCVPILIQMPVFFGLYQALLTSIELRHAPFITHLPGTNLLWLADLSSKDPFYITPIIMPLYHYEGPVQVVRTLDDWKRALPDLMTADLLGFDTETRPSFRKGRRNDPALIQLATGNAVYLVQLARLPFGPHLVEILANPDQVKAGVGIRDDMLEDVNNMDHVHKEIAFLEEEADLLHGKIIRALSQTFITPIDREDILRINQEQEECMMARLIAGRFTNGRNHGDDADSYRTRFRLYCEHFADHRCWRSV